MKSFFFKWLGFLIISITLSSAVAAKFQFNPTSLKARKEKKGNEIYIQDLYKTFADFCKPYGTCIRIFTNPLNKLNTFDPHKAWDCFPKIARIKLLPKEEDGHEYAIRDLGTQCCNENETVNDYCTEEDYIGRGWIVLEDKPK